MGKNQQNLVTLGSKKVALGEKTYFIAEIGNNHNGDFFIAKRSIQEAANAGADAVKFQKRFIEETFAAELRDKPQDKGDIKGKTYGEYREALELSKDELIELKKFAEDLKMDFFVTPFDIKSADLLEEINVPFYKIASFDLTNLPLLEHVASFKKPIILSTGMSSESEVKEAVELILKSHNEIILLHCVSVYPSPDEQIHIRSMKRLMELFPEIPVGYSGHEQDILASTVAIASGACVVERHFTLSRYLPGPDHASVSIEPDAFNEMVITAERIAKMQGSADKVIQEGEVKAREKHSKSIVASVSIKAGEVIAEDMLAFKSPGYGFKPRDKHLVIGKKANNDIAADEVIRKDSIG